MADQLGLGPPEGDRYAPVVRSGPEPRRHQDASVRRRVAGATGGGSGPRHRDRGGGSSWPRRGLSWSGGLSAADRHAIAIVAGVDERAVLGTNGGAVASRWRDGRVELLRASRGQDWTITVVDSVEAPRPSRSAASAMGAITCVDNAERPSFVFGMLTGTPESHLRMHGVDGIGGELSDGTFVFAVTALPGAPFWIDGPNHPAAPSPWPTAPGVVEPAHPDAYFTWQIPDAVVCPRVQ